MEGEGKEERKEECAVYYLLILGAADFLVLKFGGQERGMTLGLTGGAKRRVYFLDPRPLFFLRIR